MNALSNAVNETLLCNETGECGQSSLAETREWKTVMAVYLSAILIISIAFNGTLCLLFYKKSHLLNVSNCFVLNLVCCQLCISILILPFCIVAIATQSIVATGACCDVQGFCFTVIIVANQLALLAISVDRNYAIMNSLRYPHVFTQKLCIILICASWIVALLLSVPPLIRSNMGRYKFHPNQFLCTLDWTSTSEYLFLFCTISFGIPILIQSYCYIQIFKAALGHSTRGRKIYPTTYSGSRPPRNMEISTGSDNADSDANLHGFIECKAVRTIFVIAIAYSVCWVPYLVESFLNMSNIGVSPKFSAAAICFVFSTGILNPMIYAFMNRVTRREIERFVCGHLYLKPPDEPVAIRVSTYLPTWLSQYRTRSRHFGVIHNDIGTILEEKEKNIYRDTIPGRVAILEADTRIEDIRKNMKNPLKSLNVKSFLLIDKLIFYSEIDRVFKHFEKDTCNDKESCIVELNNVPDVVMDTQQDQSVRKSNQKQTGWNIVKTDKFVKQFRKSAMQDRNASFKNEKRKKKRDHGSFLYFKYNKPNTFQSRSITSYTGKKLEKCLSADHIQSISGDLFMEIDLEDNEDTVDVDDITHYSH